MGKRFIIVILIGLFISILYGCAAHKSSSVNDSSHQNEIVQLREDVIRQLHEYNERIDSINRRINVTLKSTKLENRKIITFEPSLPIVPGTGLPPVKSIEESYSSEINELKSLIESIEKRFNLQIQSIRDSMSYVQKDSTIIEENIVESSKSKRRPQAILIICAIVVLISVFIFVYRYLKHK